METKIPRPSTAGHRNEKPDEDYITRIKSHLNTLKDTPHKYASYKDAAAAGLPAPDGNTPNTIGDSTAIEESAINNGSDKHAETNKPRSRNIYPAQAQPGKQEEAPFTPCHTAVHSSRPSTELADWERGGEDKHEGEEDDVRDADDDVEGEEGDGEEGQSRAKSLYDELAGAEEDEHEAAKHDEKPEDATSTATAQASNELIDAVKRAGDKWGYQITFCAMDENNHGSVGVWRPRFVPVCYLDENEILVVLFWLVGGGFMMQGYPWTGIGFMAVAAVIVGVLDRARLWR